MLNRLKTQTIEICSINIHAKFYEHEDLKDRGIFRRTQQ